jgi:signal transduction histidine kinase
LKTRFINKLITQALRERLERTSPGHFALLLHRDVVEAKVNQDEKQSNYIPSDLSDEFVYEASLQTDEVIQRDRAYTAEHITQINQAIRDRVAPKLQSNQAFALAINTTSNSAQLSHDLVVFLPLKNLQGKVVAYVVAYEPDQTIASYYHGFYIQLVGVSLSILLLIAFIYVTNRGKEQAQQHQVEIARTLNQLKQVQSHIQREKMASLGQLVGGIAHELNNPISFIYGNSLYAKEYAEE